MSFKLKPNCEPMIGSATAREPYFCTICTRAIPGGKTHTNTAEFDLEGSEFLDIHITKQQAEILVNRLNIQLNDFQSKEELEYNPRKHWLIIARYIIYGILLLSIGFTLGVATTKKQYFLIEEYCNRHQINSY